MLEISQCVCWWERIKDRLGKTQGVQRWCHLNWTNRECKKRRDNRVRITMKEKRSSGRESPTWTDNPSW